MNYFRHTHEFIVSFLYGLANKCKTRVSIVCFFCSTFDNQSEQDERRLHAGRGTNQPHEPIGTSKSDEPKVISQALTEDESAERKSEYY